MSMSDETLMAFADGTLPHEEAARVADRVAGDPDLAERVSHLRLGLLAARDAFADVLDEPVPERLLATLRAGTPATMRVIPGSVPTATAAGITAAPARRRLPARGMAIAASVLIGLFGGWMLRGEGPSGPGAIGADLAAALDHQPSGADATAIRLLATHALPDGGACRSFALQGMLGLACRDAAGPWRIAALVARGGDGGSFTPASGEDPLLAEVLERRGAAPAMDATTERAAIARGWRPPG